MDRNSWQRIEKIVDTALSMEKSERKSYIEQECGNEPEIKSEVTKLLESIENAEASDYLESREAFSELKSDLAEADYDQQSPSLIGEHVGRYEILELIDHGGMSSVYLAKRSDGAFEGEVALKVMRRGMDTPSNVARFQRERNILASLDHPNIARLLDGGVTDQGLPYLVMEYVEGTPLYDYCNNNRLSLSRRLEIFKTIARAVQYAHKNAVIHRDLKPSNILVTDENNVKILDFGIAKLTGNDSDSTKAFETREGERILTMAYAAPEQFEGRGVTTTTDLYTLGILLYELLAGVHPFDLEDKSLTKIEEEVRHSVPVSPSNKLLEVSRQTQDEIGRHRRREVSDLLKRLKGDLDAIILKALRKDPEARYDSADQLLDDLQRYEKNEPILAREDTVRYKVKKFVKRHKNGLVTTAATLLLISSIVGYYTMRLTQQKNKAQREAQKAEQVTTFLTDLIASNYPENSQGDTITVRQFLNRGYKKVQDLEASPAVQANVMQVMAHTYHSLGEYGRADSLVSSVIRMQDSTNISKSERANAYNLHGIILREQGDIKQAEHVLSDAMRLYQESGKTDNAKFTNLLRDLAYIKRMNANYQEAQSLAERALKLEKQLFGPNSIKTAETHYVLASALRYLDQYEEAKQHQRRSLHIVESNIDGPHPGKTTNYNNLAILYEIQDSLKKAGKYYGKSIRMSKKLYGGAHHNTAAAYANLSQVMQDQDQIDSAEVLIKKAIRIRRQVSGNNHPNYAIDLGDYAHVLYLKKRHQEADSVFAKSLGILQKNYENDHPQVANIKYEQALNARYLGDTTRATRLLQEVLDTRSQRYEPGHFKLRNPLNDLVDIYEARQARAMVDSLRKMYSTAQ